MDDLYIYTVGTLCGFTFALILANLVRKYDIDGEDARLLKERKEQFVCIKCNKSALESSNKIFENDNNKIFENDNNKIFENDNNKIFENFAFDTLSLLTPDLFLYFQL